MSAPRKLKQAQRFSPVHPDAAGIDIGSRFHVVAVSQDRDPEPVRSFNTFTHDLHRLADWLMQCGITTVAMESTGVYWIPVFEILEERGLEVLLVNARDVKNVPGRKTDVQDAQWLQQLHHFGLVRGSFRPAQQVVALRAYLRQRESLQQYAASHIQHMQKALDQMNVQLHHVVTDITGLTGMSIIRDILAGTRDPAVLVQHRDGRCGTSVEVMQAALVGNYRDEHLFALKQAVDLFDCYQEQIKGCDEQAERVLNELQHGIEPPQTPRAKSRQKSARGLGFDAQKALHHILGLDVTHLPGIGPYVALKLVAECGTDMSRWPTAKHFTSWLTLAPRHKITGGKVISSRTRRSSNRAASLLRLAACTVGRTQTALGAFYRRLAARAGKAKAITATARKIAVLYYNSVRYGMDYVDPGASYYEERYQQRVLANLRKRAQSLGYALVDGQDAILKARVS